MPGATTPSGGSWWSYLFNSNSNAMPKQDEHFKELSDPTLRERQLKLYERQPSSGSLGASVAWSGNRTFTLYSSDNTPKTVYLPIQHAKRPSPDMEDSIRKGSARGFLIGCDVTRAPDISRNWGRDGSIYLYDPSLADVEYVLKTDHLPEETETRQSVLADPGANLFFITLNGDDLPTYHFWQDVKEEGDPRLEGAFDWSTYMDDCAESRRASQDEAALFNNELHRFNDYLDDGHIGAGRRIGTTRSASRFDDWSDDDAIAFGRAARKKYGSSWTPVRRARPGEIASKTRAPYEQRPRAYVSLSSVTDSDSGLDSEGTLDFDGGELHRGFGNFFGKKEVYYDCPVDFLGYGDADLGRLVEIFEDNLRTVGLESTLRDFFYYSGSASQPLVKSRFSRNKIPTEPPKRAKWPEDRPVETIAWKLAQASRSRDGQLSKFVGDEPWTRDDNIGFWIDAHHQRPPMTSGSRTANDRMPLDSRSPTPPPVSGRGAVQPGARPRTSPQRGNFFAGVQKPRTPSPPFGQEFSKAKRSGGSTVAPASSYGDPTSFFNRSRATRFPSQGSWSSPYNQDGSSKAQTEERDPWDEFASPRGQDDQDKDEWETFQNDDDADAQSLEFYRSLQQDAFDRSNQTQQSGSNFFNSSPLVNTNLFGSQQQQQRSRSSSYGTDWGAQRDLFGNRLDGKDAGTQPLPGSYRPVGTLANLPQNRSNLFRQSSSATASSGGLFGPSADNQAGSLFFNSSTGLFGLRGAGGAAASSSGDVGSGGLGGSGAGSGSGSGGWGTTGSLSVPTDDRSEQTHFYNSTQNSSNLFGPTRKGHQYTFASGGSSQKRSAPEADLSDEEVAQYFKDFDGSFDGDGDVQMSGVSPPFVRQSSQRTASTRKSGGSGGGDDVVGRTSSQKKRRLDEVGTFTNRTLHRQALRPRAVGSRIVFDLPPADKLVTRDSGPSVPLDELPDFGRSEADQPLPKRRQQQAGSLFNDTTVPPPGTSNDTTAPPPGASNDVVSTKVKSNWPTREVRLYDGTPQSGSVLPDRSRPYKVWWWMGGLPLPGQTNRSQALFWKAVGELLGDGATEPGCDVELRVYDGKKQSGVQVSKLMPFTLFRGLVEEYLHGTDGDVFVVPVAKANHMDVAEVKRLQEVRSIPKERRQAAEGTGCAECGIKFGGWNREQELGHWQLHKELPDLDAQRSQSSPQPPWWRCAGRYFIQHGPRWTSVPCVYCGVELTSADAYAQHHQLHFRGKLGSIYERHPGVLRALRDLKFAPRCSRCGDDLSELSTREYSKHFRRHKAEEHDKKDVRNGGIVVDKIVCRVCNEWLADKPDAVVRKHYQAHKRDGTTWAADEWYASDDDQIEQVKQWYAGFGDTSGTNGGNGSGDGRAWEQFVDVGGQQGQQNQQQQQSRPRAASAPPPSSSLGPYEIRNDGTTAGFISNVSLLDGSRSFFAPATHSSQLREDSLSTINFDEGWSPDSGSLEFDGADLHRRPFGRFRPIQKMRERRELSRQQHDFRNDVVMDELARRRDLDREAVARGEERYNWAPISLEDQQQLVDQHPSFPAKEPSAGGHKWEAERAQAQQALERRREHENAKRSSRGVPTRRYLPVRNDEIEAEVEARREERRKRAAEERVLRAAEQWLREQNKGLPASFLKFSTPPQSERDKFYRGLKLPARLRDHYERNWERRERLGLMNDLEPDAELRVFEQEMQARSDRLPSETDRQFEARRRSTVEGAAEPPDEPFVTSAWRNEFSSNATTRPAPASTTTSTAPTFLASNNPWASWDQPQPQPQQPAPQRQASRHVTWMDEVSDDDKDGSAYGNYYDDDTAALLSRAAGAVHGTRSSAANRAMNRRRGLQRTGFRGAFTAAMRKPKPFSAARYDPYFSYAGRLTGDGYYSSLSSDGDGVDGVFGIRRQRPKHVLHRRGSTTAASGSGAAGKKRTTAAATAAAGKKRATAMPTTTTTTTTTTLPAKLKRPFHYTQSPLQSAFVPQGLRDDIAAGRPVDAIEDAWLDEIGASAPLAKFYLRLRPTLLLDERLRSADEKQRNLSGGLFTAEELAARAEHGRLLREAFEPFDPMPFGYESPAVRTIVEVDGEGDGDDVNSLPLPNPFGGDPVKNPWAPDDNDGSGNGVSSLYPPSPAAPRRAAPKRRRAADAADATYRPAGDEESDDEVMSDEPEDDGGVGDKPAPAAKSAAATTTTATIGKKRKAVAADDQTYRPEKKRKGERSESDSEYETEPAPAPAPAPIPPSIVVSGPAAEGGIKKTVRIEVGEGGGEGATDAAAAPKSPAAVAPKSPAAAPKGRAKKAAAPKKAAAKRGKAAAAKKATPAAKRGKATAAAKDAGVKKTATATAKGKARKTRSREPSPEPEKAAASEGSGAYSLRKR